MIAEVHGNWERQRPRAVALGLFVFALLVRMAFDVRESIWLDEAIAITNASQDFVRMPWHLLRFDMHPAVYFVQLKMWMFVSTDEAWIRFNSAVWGAVSVGTLYLVCKTHFSNMTAVLAAILLAVLPGAIFYSHEIRMYAMTFTLVILVWHLNSRYWARTDSAGIPKISILCGIAVMEILVVHSHAIGFFTVFFLGLMALADGWSDVKARSGRFWYWMIAQFTVVLAAAPVVATSLVRSSASSDMGSFRAVVSGIRDLVFGYAPKDQMWFFVVAIGVYVILVLVAWRIREIRRMTVILVLLPPLLMILISVGIKPMFKARALTFTYPFLCIALAHGGIYLVDQVKRKTGIPALASIASIAIISLISTQLALMEHRTWQDYRGASDLILAGQREEDVVLVISNGSFWGMNWYINGPDWGTPLEVHNPDVKSRWRRLGARLDENWKQRMGVFPVSNRVDGNVATVYVGSGSVADALLHKRVWYVHYRGRDFEIPESKRRKLCLTAQHDLAGLQVFAIETAMTGAIDRCKVFQID